MEDRRSGNAEILSAIHDHATESKLGIARLEEKILGQGNSIDRIGTKVDETAERVKGVETDMITMKNHTGNQYERIEALEQRPPDSSSGFFNDPINQKIILVIFGVMIFGILSFAGFDATQGVEVLTGAVP